MHKVRWLSAFLALLLCCLHYQASARQGKRTSIFARDSIFSPEGGNFSIGARSTINIFTNEPGSLGTGVGASYRIQLASRVNTEWFADYVINNLYNKAVRTDAHIGWNVMYYLLDPHEFKRKFTPFVAAGHCFDYSGIRLMGPGEKTTDRWTSAVQMSVGCHYNITPKFDISLTTLYDLHLGREVDADVQPDGSVTVTSHANAGWEGHMMFIISAHYKIAKLWKNKK